MEEKLNEIISKHEQNLAMYIEYRNSRNEKMRFLSDHKFDHEVEFLRVQKEAVSDILYDYQNIIESLRELLNAWES
jgi:hypothetical protein